MMTNRQAVSKVGATFLALALAGCGTGSPHVSNTSGVSAASQSQSQSQSQPAAASVDKLWRERAGAAQGEFCLGPGDLLEISVPRVDDMQGLHARIDPAGMITLPNVGAIQGAGLTR